MATPEKKKKQPEPNRILIAGRPDYTRCDNTVVSARYTLWNFLPKATLEQFRRFANMYFLVIGIIMCIGTYTDYFESAISPWTTLGPLAFVISISLLVEGSADAKRHLNDDEVNNSDCVVLSRADELEEQEDGERDEHVHGGRDVLVNINKAYYDAEKSTVRGMRQRAQTDPGDPSEMVRVAFQKIKRKDIRQGRFVLVKNREMIPADMLLLASSNDRGGAYIETSSIDGETNLKLRNSPHLPKHVVRALRDGTSLVAINEVNEEQVPESKLKPEFESIDMAVKRLTRFSVLGRPEASSALDHPLLKDIAKESSTEEPNADPTGDQPSSFSRRSFVREWGSNMNRKHRASGRELDDEGKYVAALTTEPPNASVHTFSGKLTLPPFGEGYCQEISLGAENVLLRGAVLRNTEWALGLAFFTGRETKLVQNSFETPSKFSQLDRLMNKTVIAILCLMATIIAILAGAAVSETRSQFDELFYLGFNKDKSEPWPYLSELEPPDWITSTDNWLQYAFLFVTLLSNFIPLSLYVTIEMVQFCMVRLINVDLDMYDDTTNTRALARSTIVSDLGRIQYIFSDKTGTLTQNVMRFKRCSVDGMAFGAPIQRMRPGADDNRDETSPFHPLRQLLVGRFSDNSLPSGLEGLGEGGEVSKTDNELTFHAEMFLRVMSLCHTVVVEKDIENLEEIGAVSNSQQSNSIPIGLFKRLRTRSEASVGSKSGSVGEIEIDNADSGGSARAETPRSDVPENRSMGKNVDGAPAGFAYQAESPDEEALVSAASLQFGFQVIARDMNGITLSCSKQSHLHDSRVVDDLKSKRITLDRLAAETAIDTSSSSPSFMDISDDVEPNSLPRVETWSILAVNKFDSDRKRMSVLLRSPPELGNLPILFCKGADSSMIDPEVCSGAMLQPDRLNLNRSFEMTPVSEGMEGSDGQEESFDEVGYDVAQMLGLQMHLGEFAREGLRTLVLGMRVLDEDECKEWLLIYEAAATSIRNRDDLFREAAIKIEKNLHIVGATAIEDRLQKNVPGTIANLGRAGIKLWVLTGDKRETAIEIGYSTNVLTPRMHLIEVADNERNHVRTQMAMEFIRLIKQGRLPQYQKYALNETARGEPTKQTFRQKMKSWCAERKFRFGKASRWFARCFMRLIARTMNILGMKEAAEAKLDRIAELKAIEKKTIRDIERRRKVRHRADRTIRLWQEKQHANRPVPTFDDDDSSVGSEEVPAVFNRASTARAILSSFTLTGDVSRLEMRDLSIAMLTAKQAGEGSSHEIVDEDTLSIESFVPNRGDVLSDFDHKTRTLLERWFAVDRAVRKGRLQKHARSLPMSVSTDQDVHVTSGPRALVIEGSALKHLLGDSDFEEILFAAASSCVAVIACRVSPKQKAELVNLVRKKVSPEPITLAIGDGANDVGMIQEAHVGIGISGREGKQAVNASDFAIAQFRFLEPLLLIHGRWNFFRLSTVVLFSFYKNAVMAGSIIAYSLSTIYSGTPIFDQWIVAILNFVAAFPIIFLGIFDRCLDKDYVLANPEVYRATRDNELITNRTLTRWVILTIAHIMVLYCFTIPVQSYGGGITPAFLGLMRKEDRDRPGNGEGGDLKSTGTVTFTALIILLAYKVLYESKSLLHGIWPAFTCREGVGEGFFNRVAYTWIGVTYLSIGFYLFCIYTYSLFGRLGAGGFSDFTDVAMHVLGTRSLSWMLIAFVPIMGIAFDVVLKVFSNMFYPTQTQIHIEMESKQHRERKLESSGTVTETRTAARNDDDGDKSGRSFSSEKLEV